VQYQHRHAHLMLVFQRCCGTASIQPVVLLLLLLLSTDHHCQLQHHQEYWRLIRQRSECCCWLGEPGSTANDLLLL
jgi:hypothetical protein